MMHDHILTLNDAHSGAITSDWYKMHLLLYRYLGKRACSDGNSPPSWQFCIDPASTFGTKSTVPVRQVVLRSCSPESTAAAAALSPARNPTYIPVAGEIVEFQICVSSARNSVQTADKYSFNFKNAVAELRRKNQHLSENDARSLINRETLAKRLANSGLETIGDYTQFTTKALSVKPRGQAKAIPKTGIFASGVARVIDLDQVRKTLMSGIGRDRSYGFGMLIIQSKRENMQ